MDDMQNEEMKQVSIKDFFERIKKKNEFQENIVNDSKYALHKISQTIDKIKVIENEVNMNHFMENINEESIFNLLLSTNNALSLSANILHNLKDILNLDGIKVLDITDLALKWHIHGLRFIHLPECSEGECIIYCVICCKEPQYPANADSTILNSLVRGRIIDLNMKCQGNQKWTELKTNIYRHFIKNQNHSDAVQEQYIKHKTVNERAFETQRNQFRIVIRMISISQSSY